MKEKTEKNHIKDTEMQENDPSKSEKKPNSADDRIITESLKHGLFSEDMHEWANQYSFCGYLGDENSLDEALWQYAEGTMRQQETEKMNTHLESCVHCLARLVGIQHAMHAAGQDPQWDHLKFMQWIERKQSQEMLTELKGRLRQLSRLTEYKAIFSKIRTGFEKVFSYPCPRFSPVFGDSSFSMLSPFGKIRSPLVFEWTPYAQADSYYITISDLDWTHTTRQTKVEIDLGEIKAHQGQEYIWKLDIIKDDRVVRSVAGFFVWAVQSQIDALEAVRSEIWKTRDGIERLILWAGVLEEMAFYMDAISIYKAAYSQKPLPSLAYKIASCYDQLELDDLKDNWNRKIPLEGE